MNMDEGFSLGKIVFFFFNGNNIESGFFFSGYFSFLTLLLLLLPLLFLLLLNRQQAASFCGHCKRGLQRGVGGWWVGGESQVEAKPQLFSEPLTHSGVGFKWYTHTFL